LTKITLLLVLEQLTCYKNCLEYSTQRGHHEYFRRCSKMSSITFFLNGTVLLIRPAENYPAHASSLWVFLKVIIVAKLYFDTANIEQTTLN